MSPTESTPEIPALDIVVDDLVGRIGRCKLLAEHAEEAVFDLGSTDLDALEKAQNWTALLGEQIEKVAGFVEKLRSDLFEAAQLRAKAMRK